MGGSEIQCDLIAKGLVGRGHEVIYVAPTGPDAPAEEYGYPVASVEDSARGIVDYLDTFEADVVYWRYNLNHFLKVSSRLASKGVPIVFAASHLTDLNPWFFGRDAKGLSKLLALLQRLQRLHNQRGLKTVKALTTLNSDYLSLSPVPRSVFIPNAMETDSVPFFWSRPFVAWIANLKATKRPEVFVEACETLADHGIDGIIVGEIQEPSYAWVSDPKNLPRNVYFLGVRSPREVNGILHSSLFHAHTCRPEGFGNVFIQAWLQGRPSVSLGFDPNGYIREKKIGAVADDDEPTFKKMLLSWSLNETGRLEAGLRARKFALDTFRVPSMVKQVERVLRQSC